MKNGWTLTRDVVLFSMLLGVVCSLTACNTEKKPEQATTADANAHPGKAIHDANCISCHDTGKYTRADRTVKDFKQLVGRVQVCDANLGAKLSEKDLTQITAYLNDTFYKFPKP